ncbi:pimeloyl-ACP methyl ester carboxylesterase [Deinobacterium chartae]|uniref:Pimeloyl-ACP methyl ester carboxylesterase n=1 Tax=Deinobacterium chartae TaxID=521158 RepID=A0A841I1A1_9DEIO|nr:alpha/beta fold hydrolase [Deinobacterium chartae]MBB6099581.1 pimeloyl-ACP methyl ester carboxylesterase [Deinobacterium chartae]
MILLLHAYPLSGRMWAALEAELRARGAQTWAPDYPGFGGTPGALRGLPDLARDLLAELEARGARDISAIGLSMGGYLLFELLRQDPERFGALVFADTRAEADPPELRERREQQAKRALEEGLDWLPQAALPGLLSQQAPEALQQQVRDLIAQASPQGVAAALRAMAKRPDSRDLLPELRVPVLALAGSHDTLTPPEALRSLAARVPGAEYREIPGAGHLASLEAPDAFNAAVIGFLEAHGRL